METAPSQTTETLTLLRSETPFLHANLEVARLALIDEEADYRRRRSSLADVVNARRVVQMAEQDLSVHAEQVRTLDQRQVEEQRQVTRKLLEKQLKARRRELVILAAQCTTRLQNAERELHTARLEARELWRQEVALMDKQRADFAQVLQIDGKPSPADRILTPEEKSRFEESLMEWRGLRDQAPSRMDQPSTMHTANDPRHVSLEHEARWLPVLNEVIQLLKDTENDR